VVTCRRTQKEAEEYYHHAIIDNADFAAIDGILAKKNITVASHGLEEVQRQRKHYANGMGGLLIVGDADRVANTLAELSSAGLTGMAISFINYLDELDFFCDEVLGRLERIGLREGRQRQQARSA
jgi:alkanesulfonate monooxygenase SsuD/methylene tetrahydromethanopterin reductase-like flavin-dependent oxidoreductase (luciferase family)